MTLGVSVFKSARTSLLLEYFRFPYRPPGRKKNPDHLCNLINYCRTTVNLSNHIYFLKADDTDFPKTPVTTMTMTNTHTQRQRHKTFQEECVNVYRLKCPLDYDLHYPLEDKDKDRGKDKDRVLKRPSIYALFLESRGFKHTKYHILTSQLFVGQPDQT